MAQLYDKGSGLPVSGIAVRTSYLTTNLHRLKVTSWDWHDSWGQCPKHNAYHSTSAGMHKVLSSVL